ncbi:MAG: PTS sugar transporter subunit IIA [Planctomycetes bacterium]|nr:PTS sugar transporter subunit IIA [Planctomycetota bacterium]
MIHELIGSAAVIASLESRTKDEAIAEMVRAARAHGLVTEKAARIVLRKVREREQLGSTGIGNGIAVPHVKLDPAADARVPGVAMVLARSVDGLDYDAVDGRPVHTLFLIVAPSTAAEAHLRVLKWVSTLARNADFRRFVQNCETEAKIRDLLREMTGPA